VICCSSTSRCRRRFGILQPARAFQNNKRFIENTIKVKVLLHCEKLEETRKKEMARLPPLLFRSARGGSELQKYKRYYYNVYYSMSVSRESLTGLRFGGEVTICTLFNLPGRLLPVIIPTV
jgi:hypothetical protein